MKRFFVSIITICCLISCISANSLLLTPHHVSFDAQIHSLNLLDNGISPSGPFHVDADGKTETTIIKDASLQHYPNAALLFHEIASYDLSLNALSGVSLSPFPFENFQVRNLRTILFPFHSFW